MATAEKNANTVELRVALFENYNIYVA